MGDPTARPALLRYRPWRGRLRGPLWASAALARVGLGLILRRKLFWALYGLGLMIFLLFFYGQYLQVWLQTQLSESTVRLGTVAGPEVRPDRLVAFLTDQFKVNGSGFTLVNYVWWQGYITMVVLALAGAALVGDDFHHGSLPFYLSKPIGRRHYVLGKCLAVGGFVNLLTTLPAFVLWAEYRLLMTDWYDLRNSLPLLAGLFAYGVVLTTTLSLLVVTLSVWLRRTVPLAMAWTTLFVLGRIMANELSRFDPRWRLVDLWNDLYLVGGWFLGLDPAELRPLPQPSHLEAALVLAAVCVLCVTYLSRRIRAVEVVS